MLATFKNALQKLYRNEQGLTAAETVIIILSFAVIVTVSIYVLVCGSVFSAEKNQNTVVGGIAQATSDLEILGSVVAKCDDSTCIKCIIFSVRNTVPDKPLDLTPYDGTGNPLDETAINLSTTSHCFHNVKWSSRVIVASNDNDLLELGEQFEITIDVTNLENSKTPTNPLTTNSPFTIEVKPARSSALVIKRTIPAELEKVMVLQ